jgi:hypothetical protein
MNIPRDKAKEMLSRTDLCSREEAFEYAKKSAMNHDIWKAVVDRSDVQEYLQKTLSITEAIAFARDIEHQEVYRYIWKTVLGREDVEEYLSKILSITDGVEYANEIGDWKVWEIIIARPDVTEYFSTTLTPSEAADFAKRLSSTYLWQLILHRTDITPVEALSFGKETKWYYDGKIWDTIFARKDVQEYLLKTPPLEILEYAKTINYWRIWGEIFKERADMPFKESILAYKARTIEEGYYGSNIDKISSLGFGKSRMSDYLYKTLSPAEALAFAKEMDVSYVWEWVFMREDLPQEEALAVAKEINQTAAWKSLLARKSISKTDAIAYAKEIDDEQVWKVVFEK